MNPFVLVAVGVVLALGAMTLGLAAPAPDEGPVASVAGLIPETAGLHGRIASGPQPWLDIAADPGVRRAIEDCIDHGAVPTLVRCRLTLVGDHPSDPQWHPRLQALYDAIEAAAWAPWVEVGRRHALDPSADRRLWTGDVEGFFVRVDVAGDIETWDARITVRLGVPPHHVEAARNQMAHRADLSFEGNTLALRAAGEPATALAEAIELARQVRAGSADPWDRFVQGGPLSARGPDAAHGRVDGVLVEARRESGRIQVTAPLGRPFPPGTLLIHGDHGLIDKTLGDPVLDTLLTVQTSDLATVRARVSDEAVRGALLDVVHGHPGSAVEEGRVVMVVSPPYGDLEGCVRKVVALVRALGPDQGA